MMLSHASESPKSWQRQKWVQLVAVLLGVAPIYGMTIISHVSRDQPYTLKDILLYTAVVGSIMLIVLVLLLWYLCGERIRDLNLKQGTWWQDLGGGVLLAALTLGVHTLLQSPLNTLFPREPMSGLGAFFEELAQNPWVLALFLGPVLWIGVAGLEEMTRVFLLTRLWKIRAGKGWRGFSVAASAVLFGLAHLYQGPAGVIDSAISGLILAAVYLRFGRILPLIVSHYLHDAFQFVMIVVLIWRGVIRF